MIDVVDAVTRSRMMAGIRGKNTKPEVAIRLGLHALGFRYRLHPKEVPGKPDIYLPRYHAALFVHGCFWHGHNCGLFKVPATRTEFWLEKIESNRRRDDVVEEVLLGLDVRSLTIWECALRGPGRIGLDRAVSEAAKWLRSDDARGEIRGTI